MSPVPTLVPKVVTSHFRLEGVNEQLTFKLLKGLNIRKATGVDGIYQPKYGRLLFQLEH